MNSLENKELEVAETVQQNAETLQNQSEESTIQQEQLPTDTPAEPIAEERVEHTKETILEQFNALLQDQVSDIKEQAEQLKTQFYRTLNQEKEALRKQIEDAQEDYQPVIDELEQNFRQLWTVYKERRAEEASKREAEQKQNQLRKENIIEQLRTYAESETADIAENMQHVKELQQEWKTIGKAPATVENQLGKLYNAYLERFYDLVHINNELREYDFKKNLEQKTQLCEQAEALAAQTDDVVGTFRSLQTLHEDWKNIGPVARELREDIWNRFKEASTIINKRHQDFFEQLHNQEEENLQKKQAIIARLQEIDLTTLTTNKLWDEATEKLIAMQTEWRTIGFAPKKFNQQVYEEYKAICDKFFAAKNEFYKTLKAGLAENLAKKRELLRQAEELKDSTDWKKATDTFVRLQQTWKEVGPVARKQSEELWAQFSAACDHFFAQKKAANQGQHTIEKENLEKKKAIVAQIEALDITDKEHTLEQLHALIAQYNAVGFVPFRDKDKLYKQFRAATDKVFDNLHVEAQNRRLDAFSKAVEGKDEQTLNNDRRRLLRQYDALQAEIKTAENNILFFSGNSKKGNKLVEDMERKIQQQRNQLAEIEKRIKLIDSKLD